MVTTILQAEATAAVTTTPPPRGVAGGFAER
jgi:hypothetical protein